MKGLVVPQPKATLVALGIKTILDMSSPPNGPMRPDGVRGLPGLAVERGERIAIVAGAARPKDGFEVGPYAVDGWIDDPSGPCLVDYSQRSTHGHDNPWDLPLGAVVCTVGVADALPIFGDDDELTTAWLPHLAPKRRDGGLWRWHGSDDHAPCPSSTWKVSDITDQLPLGDFTPGRWGWMLTDPRPCDPVPCARTLPGVFTLPEDDAMRRFEAFLDQHRPKDER